MNKIIAIIPQKCLGFGGAFTCYEGLSLIPEVELQMFENFQPTLDTKLVIGFGLTPPKGNYWTAFVFCSPILQCEFSDELNLLNGKIQEVNKGILDYLFFLHVSSAEALKSIWGEKIKWLLPLFNKKLPEPQFEDRKGICCGGIKRGNKNNYNQALAMAISDYKEEPLITFGASTKTVLLRLSKDLFKQNWKSYDWVQPNNKYYNILRKVKLGLQVSLSESFCYFTLELALLKIPSIVSKTVYWYANEPKLKHCVVENPDDPLEIAEKINFVLNNESLYLELCEISYKVAQKTLAKNLNEVKKIFGGIIK
ncbi:MAG: glycosyltransferase [Candidatus Cloacimonetes bacterium]|nr:glycosyltransferase [Candidatus Cloacimonadota bacterium]